MNAQTRLIMAILLLNTSVHLSGMDFFGELFSENQTPFNGFDWQRTLDEFFDEFFQDIQTIFSTEPEQLVVENNTPRTPSHFPITIAPPVPVQTTQPDVLADNIYAIDESFFKTIFYDKAAYFLDQLTHESGQTLIQSLPKTTINRSKEDSTANVGITCNTLKWLLTHITYFMLQTTEAHTAIRFVFSQLTSIIFATTPIFFQRILSNENYVLDKSFLFCWIIETLATKDLQQYQTLQSIVQHYQSNTDFNITTRAIRALSNEIPHAPTIASTSPNPDDGWEKVPHSANK